MFLLSWKVVFNFSLFCDHQEFRSCDPSQTCNRDHDKLGVCIVIMRPCPVYKANSLSCAHMEILCHRNLGSKQIFLKFASQWLLITEHRPDMFFTNIWGNNKAGGHCRILINNNKEGGCDVA